MFRASAANPVASQQDAHVLVLYEHYTLTATALTVTGRPTLAEHEDVGRFIGRAFKAGKWWLADWMRYGESREDWQERLSQVSEALGVSDKRAANIRAVGAFPVSRRRDGVEFALHGEVAGLAEDEQDALLQQAEEEQWDRRDLREAVRGRKRRQLLSGRADTMHTVEVSVQIDVEAQTPFAAEEAAWQAVKVALQSIKGAKVIAAHTRPRWRGAAAPITF